MLVTQRKRSWSHRVGSAATRAARSCAPPRARQWLSRAASLWAQWHDC